MTLLEQVDKDNLSDKDLAYYSLLYTQAQIKCGVDVSSDSLIKIAYDAYKRSGSYDLRKRVCFYKAQVAYYGGKLQSAMKDVLVAYEIAKEEDNPYWIAKSAELTGDIFYDSYNYPQSEVYTREGAENYLKAGKVLNHRYALSNLASVYISEGRHDESVALWDSLRRVVMSESPIDSALIDYIDDASMQMLINDGRYNDVRLIFNRLENKNYSEESLDNTIIKSYLYHNSGKSDNAAVALSNALGMTIDDKEHIRVLYVSYRQALADEDYRKAVLLCDTILFLQSELVYELLSESVTGVQRDYYSAEAIIKEQKNKSLFNLLIVVITAAVVAMALLLIVYRLKMRIKKSELESHVASILQMKEQAERITGENRSLSQELDERNGAVEALRQQLEVKSLLEKENALIVENLFKGTWATLNMLCNEYFERGDNEKTRAVILNDIEKELKMFRSPKNLKEIEVAVDTYMGGIMSLLRTECTFLKEGDFVFLSLVFSGFSVRAVCLFTDIKYKLFYLKKSRLSKRIFESDAPHKDLFLDRMK